MYLPRARERVLVAGRSGEYLVVKVDHERQEVDLIPAHLEMFVEKHVGFFGLELCQESPPRESE